MVAPIVPSKGPVMKYLLRGVEDIFWGYEKKTQNLWGGTKKEQNL
jgi:hypothetical protein